MHWIDISGSITVKLKRYCIQLTFVARCQRTTLQTYSHCWFSLLAFDFLDDAVLFYSVSFVFFLLSSFDFCLTKSWCYTCSQHSPLFCRQPTTIFFSINFLSHCHILKHFNIIIICKAFSTHFSFSYAKWNNFFLLYFTFVFLFRFCCSIFWILLVSCLPFSITFHSIYSHSCVFSFFIFKLHSFQINRIFSIFFFCVFHSRTNRWLRIWTLALKNEKRLKIWHILFILFYVYVSHFEMVYNICQRWKVMALIVEFE